MLTNQERLKELQKQKRELEKQLKSIEKDIALYENYEQKLNDYISEMIKIHLLDVLNESKTINIQANLSESKHCVTFHIIENGKHKYLPFYNKIFRSPNLNSFDEYLTFKEKFETDISQLKSYMLKLSLMLNNISDECLRYGDLELKDVYVRNNIIKFTYEQKYNIKYNVTIKFLENDKNDVKYTMTKMLKGYGFEKDLKHNHHIKLKSESYENNINIEYSIENECTFDNLKESLGNTFKEIENEFKNITIEID